MRVRVTLYGWFRLGVSNPDNALEVILPCGIDVAGVIEALRKTSPMLDPRSCLAMIDGARVPLDRILKEGEEMHLYPVFSGG
jgi:hypothetical protein